MARIFQLLAATALLAASQAACAGNAMNAQCTITGSEYLSSDANAEELCLDFQSELRELLSRDADSVQFRDLVIALSVEKRGSVKAKVTAQTGEGEIDYPVVGLDVMDRPVARSDLSGLARAVAHTMTQR